MAKQNRFRRTRKIVVSVFFAALLAVVLHLTARGDADPQPSAQTLTCEAMIEPLGISTPQPRLSWNLNSSMPGDKQIAYQIQVASSASNLKANKADVWDSGRVNSDQSILVPYNGPALVSGKRYYWRVRSWSKGGDNKPFSATTWWEMGLLSPQDWKAQWIARTDAVLQGDYEARPKWIWSAGDNPLTKPTVGNHQFRFDFQLAETPKSATLRIAAKDTFAVWMNGEILLPKTEIKRFAKPEEMWNYLRTLPVTNLAQGANSLAVEAEIIDPDDSNAPNLAGVIAILRLEMQDGSIKRFISNGDWKSHDGAAPGNWNAKAFDDSAWPSTAIAAEIGASKLGTPWPPEPIAYFRREFRATKPVRSARIYSTALGTYQIRLNGNLVNDDVLAPGWTDYRKRIPYQVYDVTSQIKPGANALGAILAGGWYADGLGWLQSRYNFGQPPLRFLAQLQIEYTDGSTESILTDNSWKSSTGPIVRSDIYNGEYFDANLEQKGWDSPGFADSKWQLASIALAPQGAIVAQDYQPIRKHETLQPKSVTNPKAGAYVFDLGQNMVGWAKLRVNGKKGTKVQIRFGEVLKPNGELYTDNLRSAEATDTYVLSGDGVETFEPHFTFHGFRYVELTGFPGTPTKNAVEGIVVYTSAPFSAQLSTANPMVNQLWNNILWGQRGNFLSVPTDCPQRDERLGWMGDAQVFWRAASFNANLAAFSRKFTTDIRDAQSEAGAYADVSPRVGPTGESVAGWGDAGIIIPWTAYVQFGDKRILEENWDAMEKWMRYLQSANPDFLWLNKRGNDYADWLAIGSQTPKDLIATAFWAYDATLMRNMALALGKSSDAEKYEALFGNIRSAFQKRFIKEDGTIGSGSQTSLTLALHVNLVPQEMRSIVTQKLVDDIQAHQFHLTTGFLGTPYILIELSKSGHSDVAYKLLLQKSYPSWGYMIDHGATTMWERWNGDQMLGDPGMNSFNHYAYGAVAEWLYRYAAGIDTDSSDPAFRRIVLHPQFNTDLGEINVTYHSAYGAITSHWKAAGNTVSWTAAIPSNTTALLEFPSVENTKITVAGEDIASNAKFKLVKRESGKATYEAGSGVYDFRIVN